MISNALYDHFSGVFWRGGTLDHFQTLGKFLAEHLRLLAHYAVYCEGPITVVEMIELLGKYSSCKVTTVYPGGLLARIYSM